MSTQKKLVSVIMGSQSDYHTMKESCKILDELNIHYETLVISAHRTPHRLYKFAELIEDRGIHVIIAGAGGAAHLPGMVASITTIPVLGVPIANKNLQGIDSLLSISQMPTGVPVATLTIGVAGAKNAALLAAQILALNNQDIRLTLKNWRKLQTDNVIEKPPEFNTNLDVDES